MKLNKEIFKPIILLIILAGMGCGYKLFINPDVSWLVAIATPILVLGGVMLAAWLLITFLLSLWD